MLRNPPRLLLILATLSLALSGCGGASSPRPTPQDTGGAPAGAVAWGDWRPTGAKPVPRLTEEEAFASRKRLLDAYREHIGLPPGEHPELIRWITMDESALVQAECLRSAGFEATAYPDGSIGRRASADQKSAADAAFYVCRSQYSIDPRLTGFLDRPEGKEIMYQYVSTWLAPCLQNLGISVEVPTRETFVANPSTWQYPTAGRQDAGKDHMAICRQAPPSAALLNGG